MTPWLIVKLQITNDAFSDIGLAQFAIMPRYCYNEEYLGRMQ